MGYQEQERQRGVGKPVHREHSEVQCLQAGGTVNQTVRCADAIAQAAQGIPAGASWQKMVKNLVAAGAQQPAAAANYKNQTLAIISVAMPTMDIARQAGQLTDASQPWADWPLMLL